MKKCISYICCLFVALFMQQSIAAQASSNVQSIVGQQYAHYSVHHHGMHRHHRHHHHHRHHRHHHHHHHNHLRHFHGVHFMHHGKVLNPNGYRSFEQHSKHFCTVRLHGSARATRTACYGFAR